MTTKSQEAFEALFKEVFQIQHHDWFEKDSLGYVSNSTNNGYKLYLATRKQALEEAATEIAELKAKLAEVMPLARFGAEVANYVDGMGAVSSVAIWRIATRVGVLTEDESEYAPKIGDVIEQLLKGEK